MSAIPRNPHEASGRAYDLVIVGGGILGACLALEAARRGLRPVLLEENDFGSATSANSLKVLHGGLRYLQSADLPRIFTSISERRWFCRNFPDLVRPLPCLMPLYGQSLHRPTLMRLALGANDLLSVRRNRGVPAAVQLPRGEILNAVQTAAVFPAVRREGLRGAALWYDAVMSSSERMLIEILRWATRLGATALNYVEAVGLKTAGGRVHGVAAVDRETGAPLSFSAPVVINCAGPWAPDVADAFGSPAAGLYPRALAFNLLLDRSPVSEAAVAVATPGGDRMMFLLPWNGRTLAGTYHAPWSSSGQDPVPEVRQVGAMLADLNRAVPGLDASQQHVVRIMAGFMPAQRPGEGTPASRPLIVDHSEQGGARGLYTAAGVKYTTARALAEGMLKRIYGRRAILPGTLRPGGEAAAPLPAPDSPSETWSTIIEEESVLHLDDLLLRRMDWDPAQAPPPAAIAALAAARGWDGTQQEQELKRFSEVAHPRPLSRLANG